MVVRDELGSILDIKTTSTTQLYEHHMNAVDRIRKATVSRIIFFGSDKNSHIFFLLTYFLGILK